MVQFLQRMLLFSIFCGVFYVLAIWIWGSYVPKKYKPNLPYSVSTGYTQLKEADTTKNIDILFLGSSHSYRGFDTRIFKEAGYRTFNLGTSSQTPLQTKLLLDTYLDDFNPKLVVYEVFYTTFSIDGVEASLKIIPNKPDLSTTGLVVSHKHAKVLNAHLYSLKEHCFPSKVRVSKSKMDTYVTGGYVERQLLHYSPGKYKPSSIAINDKQWAHFKANLKILKERDIPYVLVLAPVTRVRYNALVNIEYFDALMQEQGNYYNFNEVMKLDDSLYFYDSHHLNQNGVQLFNDTFIKEVLSEIPLKVE